MVAHACTPTLKSKEGWIQRAHWLANHWLVSFWFRQNPVWEAVRLRAREEDICHLALDCASTRKGIHLHTTHIPYTAYLYIDISIYIDTHRAYSLKP